MDERKRCPRCNGTGEVKKSGSGLGKSVGLFALTGIPVPFSDSKERCTRCWGTGRVKE